MKTIRKFWFVLIAPLFIFSSCNLLDSLTQDVTIDGPDQEFTVTRPSAVAGQSRVVGVAGPIEIFNKEVSMDINAEVKKATGLDLKLVKDFKLKEARIITQTSTFDLNEIKNLKMYVGDSAIPDNLVGEVTSVTELGGIKGAVFTIAKPDIYEKLGTDNKIRIILTNDNYLTLPSVDLVLKTTYITTIGF